jgi:hypothetical protein
VLRASGGDFLVMSDNGFGAKNDSADYVLRVYRIDPDLRTRDGGPGAITVESFRQAPDGTYWFGDEFGPFLVHTDATGRVINEFDLRSKSYTGRRWSYRLEAPTGSGQAIGDFTAVTNRHFLVIERDGGQGPAALFKKVFLVSLNEVDPSGFLVKHAVMDLLNIPDPHNVGGRARASLRSPSSPSRASSPSARGESGVRNDNNYPFSSGRTAGQPDDNEFIVVKLTEPLTGGGGHGHHEDDGHDDEAPVAQ